MDSIELLPPTTGNWAERAAAFRRELHELMGPHTEKPELSSDINTSSWNSLLLTVGYLVVSDRRAEYRLRFHANCRPQDFGSSLANLLQIAIQERLPFQIALPLRMLPFFRQHSDSPGTVSTDMTDNYIPSDLFGTSLVRHYLYNIRYLLNLPHIRAAVGMGGACSWLVQRWGGIDVIRLFMQGPSYKCTENRVGKTNISSEQAEILSTWPTAVSQNTPHLIWEELSPREINLLCGYRPSQSDSSLNAWIYPPPFLLEAHGYYWTSSWSTAMENMFDSLTRNIEEAPTRVVARTCDEWAEWFQECDKAKSVLPNSILDEVGKCLKEGGLRNSWNYVALGDINIPEH